MLHDPTDLHRLSDESSGRLTRFVVGTSVFLVILLVLILIYLIGEKLQGFSWKILRDGLIGFAIILLAVSTGIICLTFVVRFIVLIMPQSARNFSERRQLHKSHRDAMTAIATKERLNEERARLTAQFQATYLFEKETTATANSRAAREFQEALQSGVVRSVGVACDHIQQVVQQYEELVTQINESELPASEKTQLLRALTKNLDTAAIERKNRDAYRLMENEIWRVRLRKARLLAKSDASSAEQYLTYLLQLARSDSLRSRLAGMKSDLKKA
ncbi:MAG: hypothetical protein KDA96_01555 [Planctomycetaceae bacterium]|nr:hypothetical protein [Planctomycetaceae bacterium]